MATTTTTKRPTQQMQSGADILVECLVNHGVDVVFAYPGGASMPLHQALTRYKDRIRTILPRHEQGGGFAAQGYARTTRQARRLHGHQRARRDEPGHLHRRRQARQHSAGRHHRPGQDGRDGDIVYAVLTTGTSTTMVQDGVALFDASTHANYVTSGAAPSVATLNSGRTAMATQTDPQGKVIGLRPRHLIVPIALQTTAETLIAATYDPAGTAGTLTPNPFQNSMNVVADHRLDTHNPAGWYLAAGMNTVTVGFLNGQSSPYLESKDGWSVDGVEYKVRIDAAAVASDYRGLYYNDGA